MAERDELFDSTRVAELPDELRVPLERATRSWRAGDHDAAKSSCDVALEAATAAVHRVSVCHALHLRAQVAHSEADYAVARALHREVLRLCREIGFLGGMGAALCGLAMVDLAEGDPDAARVHHERGVACYEDGGYVEHAAAARETWAATAHVA